MGASGKSWVDEHRDAIVDAYLTYFGEVREYLNGENVGKVPENPCPVLWALYHQMERWRALPEPGALLDQPYILMIEIDALDSALGIKRKQDEQRNAAMKK